MRIPHQAEEPQQGSASPSGLAGERTSRRAGGRRHEFQECLAGGGPLGGQRGQKLIGHAGDKYAIIFEMVACGRPLAAASARAAAAKNGTDQPTARSAPWGSIRPRKNQPTGTMTAPHTNSARAPHNAARRIWRWRRQKPTSSPTGGRTAN